MNIYEIEFRATVKSAANDEISASKIARNVLLNNPDLIYIKSVELDTYNNAWGKIWGKIDGPITRPDMMIIEATPPSLPTAEGTIGAL